MSAARKANLKQHFTDAADVKLLMCSLLGSVEGLDLLEPSVGHGAFFSNLSGRPHEIYAVDIDGDALAVTKKRFQHLNISVARADFIDVFMRDVYAEAHPLLNREFDAVISNPPYGLYFEPSYRARMKRAFPGFYVRESYGLFFIFSISRLRPGGKYVFLLPDTFLSSANHASLRRYMVEHAAPEEIVRFPSRRFETVNFGYGNLCVIAGRRGSLRSDDKIRWVDAFDAKLPLTLQHARETSVVSGAAAACTMKLGWSRGSLGHEAAVASDWTTLGSIAECRTGIYTGNNERFIGFDETRISRRPNGHSINWSKLVAERNLTPGQKENGLKGVAHYVPLVRGGHRRPFDKSPFAIDWSPQAINFYKSDKKARFQNSAYYFRKGLSVPMVSAKRISAALMEGAVFDQGVVGIFPNNIDDLESLLIYLNSKFASQRMKELVNGSANNSANYLKRLPVPIFTTEARQEAKLILETARKDGFEQEACDRYVGDITNLNNR